MANVAVQKVKTTSGKPLPLFEEIEKGLEEVRCRAFESFEMRGRQLGHALEDWLKAEHEILGWPAAELAEKESNYELQMTLPGYDPKEVEVTATPSEIIVHANVKPEAESQEGKRLWSEFGPNNVYRHFDLPAPIDVEKTSATLDKGILHITAAKMPVAQAKPIEVRAA